MRRNRNKFHFVYITKFRLKCQNILIKKAGSHENNRLKVCVWCFKKENRCKTSKFVEIIPQRKIEVMINAHISYNAAAQKQLPKAICNGCLRNLYRFNKETLHDIKKPDFSRFHELKKSRSACFAATPNTNHQ